MYRKNSFCSYCGQAFAPEQPWPRRCSHCNMLTFQNPLPVAVILVPVGSGVLTIRRGIAPQQGQLALPGGYIELGESWQAAGAREVQEEAGVVVDPATIRDFMVRSAPDGTVLIFGIAAPLEQAALPPFIPTGEASERVVLDTPTELAFSLHSLALKHFFAREHA